MKFVLEQTFHQNNSAHQTNFCCRMNGPFKVLMKCVLMGVQKQFMILSNSQILIEISSKNAHSILMKIFDALRLPLEM